MSDTVKLYRVDVTETINQRTFYVVAAKSEDEARDLAERGFSISEENYSTEGVIARHAFDVDVEGEASKDEIKLYNAECGGSDHVCDAPCDACVESSEGVCDEHA